MNVTFDEIPESGRTPGVHAEFNARLATASLPTNRQKLRIIAQRIATNAPVAANNVPVQLFSDTEAATIFGAGSQCHLMARAALRAAPYVDLHMIAVPEPEGGSVAQGTIAMSGTATRAGVVILSVGAMRMQTGVSVGETAQSVLDELQAMLAARPELPVSVTASAGQLVFTAKNSGAAGNDIDIALTMQQVTGLTRTVTNLTGGSGVPDLTDALAAIYAAGDDVITMPWRDVASAQALRDHLIAVGGGVEMRGAVGVLAHAGDYGGAVSLAGSINAERVLLGWCRSTPSVAWEVAAALAAVIAAEEDPARPLNTLALAGIAAPKVSARASKAEIESCLYNGVTPLVVSDDGRESVLISRAVMTYTTTATGVDDPSWLDITSIRSMDYVRKAWRQRITLRFPREKMTARVIRAVRSETLDVLLRCEELEIVHNVRALKDQIVFEPSTQQVGTLVGRVPCNVVPGLHRVQAVFDLIL